ncbi:MAG: dTDP-4-dehydrorhamnose reductase [Proteobacteria bacterium]|nr:dTDP-4-dehydrorhamnose reductase [Pseudomonadota bacterium]
MKKTILLIGANGMFGLDAADIFTAANYQVIKATRADFDITNLQEVEFFFKNKFFDFVINTAAYTKVDDAEKEIEAAFAVNAEGAKNIAIASAQKNIPLIFISTDYVFDGTKTSPYLPDDTTNPKTIYGASKLLGEKYTRLENPCHYIVRTSWLYGKHGKNFVDTMLKISQSQKVIKVVNDQFGCPTWTHDLAYGIKSLIEKDADFGTYQICGSGATSWFEFAKKIFEISKIAVEVVPVSTLEFPRLAPRPKFSVMDNQGFGAPWQESLKNYLALKNST